MSASSVSSSLFPITHRLAILTGASGSIGKEIAIGLASSPNIALLLPLRNESSAVSLIDSLKKQTKNQYIYYELADLSNKASVQSFASLVGSKYGGKVCILVNNAAIVPDDRQLSKDGLEMQFHTNVYSYYQLITLLHPYLKAASTTTNQSRIVNVASNYAGGLDINDLQFQKREYDSNTAYRQSKQANRMINHKAAQLFSKDGITVNACHPGVTSSNVLHNLGMANGFQTGKQSAETPLFLALNDAVEGKTGGYYDNLREKSCSFKSDKTNIEKLWEYLSKL